MTAHTKTLKGSNGTVAMSGPTDLTLLAEVGAKIQETLRKIPEIKAIVVSAASWDCIWGNRGITKTALKRNKPPILVNDAWPDPSMPLAYLELGFVSKIGGVAARHQLTYHGKNMSTKQQRGGRGRTPLSQVKDIQPGMKVQVLSGPIHQGAVGHVIGQVVQDKVKVRINDGQIISVPINVLALWEGSEKGFISFDSFPTYYEQILEHCFAQYKSTMSTITDVVVHPHTSMTMLSSIGKEASVNGTLQSVLNFPFAQVHLHEHRLLSDFFTEAESEIAQKLVGRPKNTAIQREDVFSVFDNKMLTAVGAPRQIAYLRLNRPSSDSFSTSFTLEPEQPKGLSETQQLFAERCKLAKWNIF